MATSSASWEILAGSVQEESATLTFVDAGTTGTPSALRTLTHPDAANFPIVTYSSNPDRTLNFDQDVLFPPTSRILRTLGTSQVFVTANSASDVLVTEVWIASATRTRMIASFFRRLYELTINPPAPAEPEVFLVWAPRDLSDKTYNVILAGIRVGGSDIDMKELGRFAAGTVDTVATGVLDRTVELDLKIVSEIVA